MKWSLFSPRINDAWTPAIGRSPRWFTANAYNDSYYELDTPELQENSPTGISLTPTASGVIPFSWTVSNTAEISPSSTLQSLFFSLAEEQNAVRLLMETAYLSRAFNFDIAEPDRAWYVSGVNEDSDLYVETSSGFVALSPAPSLNNLLYDSKWSYYKKDGEILLSGFGVQESPTTVIDGFQFISSGSVWDSTSLSYYRHPATQSWIPFHPSNIRSDGFLGITHSGSGFFRSIDRLAINNLPVVNLRTAGVDYEATLVPLWTSVDEKALWFGLQRLQYESSVNLMKRLLACSWFSRDQSTESIRNAISSSLDLSFIDLASRSSNGLVVDSGYDFVSLRNIEPIQTITESLIVNGSGHILTSYFKPKRGTVFCQGIPYVATAASGVVSIENYTYKKGHILTAQWVLDVYTSTGSAITFTENMPEEGPDYVVLHSKGVQVLPPDTTLLSQAFDETWPGFSWMSQMMPEVTKDSATAIFD